MKPPNPTISSKDFTVGMRLTPGSGRGLSGRDGTGRDRIIFGTGRDEVGTGQDFSRHQFIVQ